VDVAFITCSLHEVHKMNPYASICLHVSSFIESSTGSIHQKLSYAFYHSLLYNILNQKESQKLGADHCEVSLDRQPKKF
jgi:hypothetical protein